MAIQLNFKCNESWEKMSQNDKGRFCKSCSKNVFDLTNKSDEEIRKLYSENKGKMCGRVTQSQIGIPFMSKQKRVLAKLCMALYLVFGGLLFTHSVNAQTNSKGINEVKQLGGISLVKQTATTYLIKGKVTDVATGEDLPFATIVLYQGDKTIKGTTTDLNGNYLIELSENEVENYKLRIHIAFVGYASVTNNEIKFSEDKELIYNVALDSREILMGDVMIEEHPVINNDPNSHGETIIDKKEIEHSPY